MAGIPGPTLDDSTKQLIVEYGVHHFIIFKRNVINPPQLTTLCAELIRYCLDHGQTEPLIAIDQEGGTVARLPLPFQQFDHARAYGDHPQAEEQIKAYATACAADLMSCGINMNFAPVLDVCPTGQNCFMEQRALGSDPHKVARLGSLIIETLQDKGVAACGKHFPGLGQGVIDPHLQLPTVSKSAAAIKAEDLLPFHKAIASGVAAIMTSHILYTSLDKENLATMSPAILTDLLRTELGYDGLLVTDDLEMGAIENDISVPQAALRAIQAGADLMLICHDHDKVRQTCTLLQNQLTAGRLAKSRLAQANRRILHVSTTYSRH